jgi:adenosylcobinamide kinase/adenosylcobinamide-phosphate guanylyltransferase
VQKNQGNSVTLVQGGAYGSTDADLEACVEDLCDALKTTSRKVILVSNEVGTGGVPAYALGRHSRDVVGEINQRVATVADTVLLMVAGLPLILKGSLEGAHR